MHIDSPWDFDVHGRTAGSDDARYIRTLIETVLFTSPGERVNRPDFGAGLRRLVFAPNSEELAAALQFAVQANLRRWLGEVVDVTGLAVKADGETLRIDVQYAVRRTGETRGEQFTKSV